MTSAEIRQSFLDFFSEKSHTIVPSASLMPQSPGLLFTNAGMNQFVPYFLGSDKPLYSPPRAADTQKCIRAGGKHNDLEDVGYDTYHHTFFEMLGNWSFGDYFKKEAIAWGWELLVERWGVPAQRVYATVYAPKKGDPGQFDQEAWDSWAKLFISKGLDPNTHIVHGNVKDNFWMMGETGPCGPCSELHIDLTPEGDSKGSLVNKGSDLCIEIWNLVFIQYNAEADGSFRELPSKHIDTGMGFERACSIIQNTKSFVDFSRRPSNYATDVFTPIFRKLESLSGMTYEDIYPQSGEAVTCENLRRAIAFRVIADHIRTLSFSIADGILPGNTGRNYVLRRILRRAVRYGRQLGFSGEKPFLAELVETLENSFGMVFPELVKRSASIKETLFREETSFNQTLDRGLEMFEQEITSLGSKRTLPGEFAFKLYDTFGFPVDLTQLLAKERGIGVDMAHFEYLMEEQRKRARRSQKSEIVRALDIETSLVTEFCGFGNDSAEAKVYEVHSLDGAIYVLTDKTPFYAEMGGQVGDTGMLELAGQIYPVLSVQQIGKARAHIVPSASGLIVKPGDNVLLHIDVESRRRTEAHHTATHLLHWALHEVAGRDVVQQGSLVSEDRLRFDFNSGPLSQAQLVEIEEKINAAISENYCVSWQEVPHEQVKGRADVMQFFGDKYGELVRVVQIGGNSHELNGFSMELCGGTHARNTQEIGLFKIKSEGAIAAGVRRIEAVCGETARSFLEETADSIIQEAHQSLKKTTETQSVLEQLVPASQKSSDATPARPELHVAHFVPLLAELKSTREITRINAILDELKNCLARIKDSALEADKSLKKAQASQAGKFADEALEQLAENNQFTAEKNLVFAGTGSGDFLQELMNGLKKRQFAQAAVLLVDDESSLHIGAYSGMTSQSQGLEAGKLVGELARLSGGKGGGRADQARGATSQREKISELTQSAKSLLGI